MDPAVAWTGRARLLKRSMDLAISALGLVLCGPLLALVSLLVWVGDGEPPLYIGRRVGKGGTVFSMVKLRSMVPHADRTGVDSTAAGDDRITRVGRAIRWFKLDELAQLWNVLRGDMSLVGPRPNVARDVRLYTAVEKRLLQVQPGITDFASIVFADEGAILHGADDPDVKYNQIIRPWKSRLGLHYIAHRSLWLDCRLICATLLNAVSRRHALLWVAQLLGEAGAPVSLVEVARRQRPLGPAPPPGANNVVASRGL